MGGLALQLKEILLICSAKIVMARTNARVCESIAPDVRPMHAFLRYYIGKFDIILAATIQKSFDTFGDHDIEIDGRCIKVIILR